MTIPRLLVRISHTLLSAYAYERQPREQASYIPNPSHAGVTMCHISELRRFRLRSLPAALVFAAVLTGDVCAFGSTMPHASAMSPLEESVLLSAAVGVAGVSSGSPKTEDTAAAGLSERAAVRFLRQSTYGPTPASIANLQKLGFQPFLNQQFGTRPTQYSLAQSWYQQRTSIIRNAIVQPDQLRQRVSFALSEIIVASFSGAAANEDAFPLWLNTLQNDAFKTYGQILFDALKIPALQAFLTNIGNDATSSGTQHISQNLGRELLQLFTVGPYLLNADGSVQTDSNGNPLPAYNNTVVDGVSRALTGWHLQPCTSSTAACQWEAPLQGLNAHHDRSAKQWLGGTVSPAGLSTGADLAALVQNIMQQPNVAPFVSTRLIQALVTSNPSPAYIARVAAVFANDGGGTVGDMKAVITAILLDPEARAGDTDTVNAGFTGHVEEPLLFVAGVMRAVQPTMEAEMTTRPAGAQDTGGPWGAQDATTLDVDLQGMGQDPLDSPSVFNFYSPSNNLAGTSTLAPEMQLETSSSVILRANFLANLFDYQTLYYLVPTNTTWLYSVAEASPDQLVAMLELYLTGSSLQASTTQAITTAVSAVPSTDPRDRICQALYLICASGQYQVIR